MEIEVECPVCGLSVKALSFEGRVRILYHWTSDGLPCRCIGPFPPGSSPGDNG